MKITVLLFCICVCLFFNGFSQDPVFINTQQSLVYLNPSFAGSNGLVRTQSLYRAPIRNQLFSSTTLYNGADVYLKSIKGGLAFTYLFDNYGQGKLTTKTGALSYAQYFSLLDNQLKIVPSLQIAFIQRALNKNMVSFGELLDPRFGYTWNIDGYGTMVAKRNLDFSSGLLINYKNFYFGSSVFHIGQPNVGFYGDTKLPARFSLHSSLNQQLNNWVFANFFVQYQRQNIHNYAQIKMNFLFVNHLIFGMGYRSNNTASFNIGYKNKYFTLGIGYDQTLTNLAKQQNSALEAQFSLNIGDKEHRNSVKSFERW